MASNSNPLDGLAAYFKPCTRRFVQEDYYNMEDTLSELQRRRIRQQRNPLDNLSAFFRPLTDYCNDELWASRDPFADKIEISNSIGITRSEKRKSPSPVNASTKKRRVDFFDDEDKSLTTIPSSDTSSSESSDDEEDDNDSVPLSEPDQKIAQRGDVVEPTPSDEAQLDDSIVENLESLSFSDNPNTTKNPTVEKRDESSRSMVTHLEKVEKENEVSWTLRKIEGGKCDQKISEENDVPMSMAGFTGRRAHRLLDVFDNQAFKARHRKIITKRVRGTNLNGGLNNLLYGFKPTSMLG